MLAGDGAPPQQGRQAGRPHEDWALGGGPLAMPGVVAGAGDGVGDHGSPQQVAGREQGLQAFFKGKGDGIWSLTVREGKSGCSPRCRQWGPT